MSGQDMSFNEAIKKDLESFKILLKKNALLRREIFNGSCKKAKSFALRVGLEAVMLENHALNCIRENGVTDEEFMQFNDDATRKNHLDVLLQNLQSQLQNDETSQEHCVVLEKEINTVKEKDERLEPTLSSDDSGCTQMTADIKQLTSENENMHQSCAELHEKHRRELEEEIVTLVIQNTSWKQELEVVQSQLPHEDFTAACVQLNSKIERFREENDALRESYTQLRKMNCRLKNAENWKVR
ncbi:hypothetical protein WMY93_028092 [Mugilogobius chulae]|uniref:Uncharacterized protein n=1 Tax=Mugilogobius chulae TaxID=88201 RepID=A0AAW0MMB9_9GOBI